MKMKITKRIGKNSYEFEVEGQNFHDAVMKSNQLSFEDVDKCGLCGSDSLVLDAYVAQSKFRYVKIKCNGCWASLTFGQKQDSPDTFYLRRREDKRFDWVPSPTPGM